ncbi:P-loop containing nucleoside triphosphate hydrolase protein [Pisolithus croceorrhizus]|nr:P-loop containing nucleoside triphosphate hydrolase protein [Pisolithus croceorrhizus]
MSDQRTKQLHKRFNDIIHGNVKLEQRSKDCHLFLQGLCEQGDPAKCANDIVANPPGLPAVQQAMRSDLRPNFLNGLASDVLEFLLRAEMGGDVLNKVIVNIVDPPIFWNEFHMAFENGTLNERAQRVFVKVLSYLLQMPNRDTTAYRQLAGRPSILDKITNSSQEEVRSEGYLIKHILSTAKKPSTSTADPDFVPGGRHDNDFPDFRDIAILPTADELTSTKKPALRPASLLEDPDGKETRVADYLDNTFRLLRDDMMHELKEDIDIALKKKQGENRGLVIDGIKVVDIYTGPDSRRIHWGLKLQCGSSSSSTDHRGSRMLRHQSLACLIGDGAIMSLGTIHRDEDLLAKKPPIIVFQIEGQISLSKALLHLKKAKQLRLIQIDCAVFAFEPVLKALQRMPVLPLSEEILFWEGGKQIASPPVVVTEITGPLSRYPSMDLKSLLQTPNSITLDDSQVFSLLTGLQQRLSLIQGPPGTGKSFIGALLAKALHMRTKQTILVVCYTNHALDQFLEDLIGIGIPREDIVRFGGRAKPALEDLSVFKMQRERVIRSKADWTLIDEAKQQASHHLEKLQESFTTFQFFQPSHETLLTYMEFEDSDYFDAFCVPDPEDTMKVVGPKGKAVDNTFLISRWMQGLDAGVFKNERHIRDAKEIWNMGKNRRQLKVEEWKLGILKQVVEDFCVAGEQYNYYQDDLSRKFGQALVEQLKTKRIIGCTTTGAAKFAEDIRAASPDVLLVEEAGEILESHVITALSSTTSQMILIGDHKQLRPKVNNYTLTVEKGEGYDLNRSLFERLVLKGFPHVTLSSQHRMPNVIFVNHSHPEDEDKLRYLAQQGYGSENIVILTPYLGQLSNLRDALKNETDPILNDLDSNDLSRAGLLTDGNSKKKKTRIRLATIDNYQGEESDIVSNSIGFMDSPERLNVLISRARNGLILIGNAATFECSKKGGKLWTDFLDLMRKGGYVFGGFPVNGTMLKCNVHPCTLRCHPLRTAPNQPNIHTTMLCKAPFSDKCLVGAHTITWLCHEGRPSNCKRCDKETKRLERQAIRDLKAKEDRETAQREHDLRMLELEAKLQFEREALTELQKAKDRENEARQKEKEIEDLKQKVKRAAARRDPQGQADRGSQSQSQPQSQSNPPSRPRTPSQDQSSGTSQPTNQNVPRPKLGSAARDKWEYQKRVEGVQNDAIDKIMDMTGLEGVKEQVLRIKAKIDTTKRQGVALDKERFNLVLLGNPGTGKSLPIEKLRLQRLYAQFLESIQVLPGDAFLETTGSSLANDGVSGAKKLVDDALKAGGGAIFIDEAYQLVSDYDQSGRPVLDYLLAEMENRVGTLVFILAGYTKEMEKFFEHNPGIPSRVPYSLQFADYTDAELLTMLEDLVLKRYKGRMQVEDGVRGLYARIAVKRLGRGRGRPGFGNARALQNMFAKICERQAERVQKARTSGMPADDFFMSKEDMIGPNPSKVLPNSAAWAKLQSLTGLESVKDSVRNFFALIETNYQRELDEKEPMAMSLNRVFLGSPGTGKTTVAQLYGKILAELGLLSNGEVVVKNPADFVGGYLGHSEKNTKAILSSTMGKIPSKPAVIDTMVAEIQSVPGEDRCVLLLGYKQQMEEMFQNVNPGLARRFAIENAFTFEDFTEPQLMQILDFKLKSQDLSATDDAKRVAKDLLSRMKNRPNFGNAGEVENLLGLAKARYQKRMATVPAARRAQVTFEPQDFDPDHNRDQNASTNLAKLFEDVVGCDDVIKKLEDYQKIARAMKAQGLDMRTQIPSNFIFKGPPGTGKTSTARKLGQVYYDMGFLSSVEVVECSASDLVGQYVGHTGPKTKAVFEKALGKVLFVDEAYRLGEGPFAKEAMDEIVGLMTQERYMNKLIIILAGYEDEMNALLQVNPGLSSRFAEEIVFQNMTSDQCLTLLDKDLRKSGILIAELRNPASAEYPALRRTIESMSSLPSWGNARDMKTIGKRMVQKAFSNVADNPGQPASLSIDEAVSILNSTWEEKRNRQNVPTPGGLKKNPPMPPTASMSGPAPPPPPTSTSTNTSTQGPKPPPPPPRQQESKDRAPKPPRNQRKPKKSPATPDESSRASSPGPSQPEIVRNRSQKQNQANRYDTTRNDTGPSSDCACRDPGVSDRVWAQLQAAKAAEEERKRKAIEEERRLQQDHVRAQREERKRQEEEERRRREEMARRLAEIERQAVEARRREQEVKAARERAAEELKRKQREEAERQRKMGEAQKRLRRLGVCIAGFQWTRIGSGWMCAGGACFVSDAQIVLLVRLQSPRRNEHFGCL